jgi:hypothetical protein
MGVKLAAASGGSIELVPTNTASTFTVTVPATTGTMSLLTDGIGYSQTWQTLTSSRAIGTTYTNSTGRPIQVAISGVPATATGGYLILTVGGVAISGNLGAGTGSGQVTSQAIVPVGATYVATYSLSGGFSSFVWNELT